MTTKQLDCPVTVRCYSVSYLVCLQSEPIGWPVAADRNLILTFLWLTPHIKFDRVHLYVQLVDIPVPYEMNHLRLRSECRLTSRLCHL